MWSKRDRVMAVLSGERPDRVPIFECLIHDGILEHFGGHPIEAGDLEGVVRTCSGCLDLCHPALVPQAPVRIAQENGATRVVERWTTWTPHIHFRHEEEMLKALNKEIESAETWQPAVTDAEDFRRQAEKTNEYAGEMVYIHLGTGCPILPFDLEQGFYAYADHPDLVKQWNQAANDRRMRQLDAIADSSICPVCILWDDIACKNQLMYPPAILEDLFYPHLAAQVDLFHSRGIKVLFHSDGDVTDALAKLVECGIDGFNPLEITAGMDPRTFQEICGKRAALVGGIDAVEVLARGTPECVEEKTRELIDLFREDGNLMVASASGEVDNSMPKENVLAMYETVWSYGKY